MVGSAIEPALAQRRPLILGVAGAQGSGKSTLARELVVGLSSKGLNVAAISLDDFYLTRAERAQLAETAHPLFETRGPPGTHDVSAAVAVLDAMREGRATTAPSFDKGADDRRPPSQDHILAANLDVVIFEGWCLGAEPVAETALAAPINDLERNFDKDGEWRKAVNRALGGGYQDLFSRIDFLVFLRAPDFDVVHNWRLEQERDLASRNASAPALMDKAAISSFIQHYERITRSMFETAPKRANLTIQLDRERRVINFIRKSD